MRTKDDTPAGISRRDNERDGTHGWTVSIQRRRQRVHRYFADREYGNRELAYQAACRCREQLLQERPGFLRREIANLHRKSNTSGVPGVCRYTQPVKENSTVDYWIAFWPTDHGKTQQLKFSVAKYGEERAFALAVTARQRALEKLDESFERRGRGRSGNRRPAKKNKLFEPDLRITRVTVLRYRLCIELFDERVITVPLSWFPVLLKASLEDRQQWAITETGNSIVWEKLGLTITTVQILKTA